MATEKNNEPVIAEDELKMPDQPFGQGAPQNTPVLGPVLAVLIVVLVLLLGGLYLWGTTLQIDEPTYTPAATRPTAEENNEPESNNAEADVQTLDTMSTSDELDAIEADLDSTNLDTLDADLNAIDAELDAAPQE